jgi:polyhydroxyalkanoate synthesis regulator phasin
MAEKQHPQANEPGDPSIPVRRPTPHRGTDVRDAVAELAERAQVISQEAGSKVAAAMKDVVSAAAGIAGFAIESARDLVQFMVRRGQMTPEEGEKLIREAEAAHEKRSPSDKGRPTASKIAADRAAAAKSESAARAAEQAASHARAYPKPAVAPPASAIKSHAAPSPATKTMAPAPAKSAAAPKSSGKPAKAAKPTKPAKAAKPAKSQKKRK